MRDDRDERFEGRADHTERVAALYDQIDSVEPTAPRTVDPGASAVVIAAAVMLLLVAALLPWIGGSSGWDVLRGTTDPSLDVGLLPRLFAAVALGFGVVLAVLVLASQWLRLAWSRN